MSEDKNFFVDMSEFISNQKDKIPCSKSSETMENIKSKKEALEKDQNTNAKTK